MKARHDYLIALQETSQLMVRVNPGALDFFEAAFGQEGIIGELATVIDTKVKGILMNRIRLGLSPLEVAKDQ